MRTIMKMFDWAMGHKAASIVIGILGALAVTVVWRLATGVSLWG